MNENEPGLDEGFHWREGWMFKRLADGTVRIVFNGAQVARIPAYEWASIVASVSETGETGDSFWRAVAFHGDPVA